MLYALKIPYFIFYNNGVTEIGYCLHAENSIHERESQLQTIAMSYLKHNVSDIHIFTNYAVCCVLQWFLFARDAGCNKEKITISNKRTNHQIRDSGFPRLLCYQTCSTASQFCPRILIPKVAEKD